MSYSRQNNASRANIKKDRIFAHGTFKNVWRGSYTRGARAGEPCVAKEFKFGSVYEDHYFQEEMNIIERSQMIIDNWHAANIINRKIILNTPQIWQYEGNGVKTLVEPFIKNFEKFNSNSGWAPVSGDIWSEAMQALSHFSYHNSGGQFVLCDLQGGMYSNGYILSDPVIMSQTQRYGPADLGKDGIRSFFQRHRCGRFCKREWTQPKFNGKALIPMRKGTTMTALPTRRGRQPLTSLAE